MNRVFKAKKIYAEGELIQDGFIEIKEDRIAAVGRSTSSRYPNATITDLGPASILPGFIDLHIHGFLDIDVTEASPGDVARLSRELARRGVTSYLPTLISASEEVIIRQADIIRQARETPGIGAKILGVHQEGPWLSYERRGAHPAQWVRCPEKQEVRRIIKRTKGLLKTVTFSPEVPDAVWLAETLSAEGIVPVMGHTNASYDQARAVIAAGARHVTHMHNAMLGFRENPKELGTIEPGIETAVYLDDRITVELIPSEAFIPQALFQFSWRVKGPEGIALVTDAGRGSGYAEGYSMEFADGRRACVRSDALRLVDEGPLNNALLGNVHTLGAGLRSFALCTSSPLDKVLPTVSLTPARILGLHHELGSLKAGKRADLAVVDDQMQVLMTIVAGEIVYQAAESRED